MKTPADILNCSPYIRYVAVYRNGQLTMQERSGISTASSADTDRFEELLVNPAVLLLTHQRGSIDCGGLRFVLIRYGNFFQFVRRIDGGHVSVAIEPTADVMNLAQKLDVEVS